MGNKNPRGREHIPQDRPLGRMVFWGGAVPEPGTGDLVLLWWCFRQGILWCLWQDRQWDFICGLCTPVDTVYKSITVDVLCLCVIRFNLFKLNGVHHALGAPPFVARLNTWQIVGMSQQQLRSLNLGDSSCFSSQGISCRKLLASESFCLGVCNVILAFYLLGHLAGLCTQGILCLCSAGLV